MRAIIADDEVHLAADLRQRLIELWPSLDVAAVLHDGPSTALALEQIKPDVAFLDIRMPGMSGLEAALAAPPGCRIVFVTAYDNYAIAAFEQAAADYLLKPVSNERLAHCVSRLRASAPPAATDELLAKLQTLLQLHSKQAPLHWLRAQVGQTVRLVHVEEVCYLQSADKYTAVFTRHEELLLRTPLKTLIAQVDAETFWQVHRGTVVNVRQIAAARHDVFGRIVLSLRDRPETLAVSRTYAHLFRQM